jgi:tetratricopeptide (TPR) repeat protein
MSIKQEIETWVAALAAYDNNEFDNALRCFETIGDTSKILFNTGVIYATLGEHGRAVEMYQRAVQLDQYLAVAYFQQGVSNFLMGDFEEALANFNDTLLYLRGNNNIDYEQLGLKFKLHSCEVLFNRGLCYIYLQQKDAGMQDLIFAAREKAVSDHDVIDEAIKEQAEGYTVFSIPVGVVYRPNEAKVKNLKKQDYLGKARLVAAFDHQQHHDPRRQAALAAVHGIDDRPGEKLSYAALNLVRPNLTSRSRLQSEPPMHRNVFPPTPPPELERPDSAYSKRKSSESLHSQASGIQASRPGAKPLRLELGVAAFEQKSQPHQQQQQPPPQVERPRMGTKRSESERPMVRREILNASSRTHDTRRQEKHRSHHLRNHHIIEANQTHTRYDMHITP